MRTVSGPNRGVTMLLTALATGALLVAAGCGSSDDATPSLDGDVADQIDEQPNEAVTEQDAESADVASDGDVDPDAVEVAEQGESAEEMEEAEVAVPTTFIIVAPEALQDSVAQYAAYRAGKGRTVEVYYIEDLDVEGDDGEGLRAALLPKFAAANAALTAATGPLFVLLIGDAPSPNENAAGLLPAMQCSNLLGDCATDNLYADLDDDGLPDFPLGRLPARSNSEVLAYLQKVQDIESRYVVGLHNRRITLFTGEAGFGEQVDAALEYLVFTTLDEMDFSFDIVGAYYNANSDYYYTPFNEKVTDLFSMGSLMTVYIGHGSADGGQGFDMEDMANIHCETRRSMALFFACSNGEFLGAADCIAETVIRLPTGPALSLAASGVSHPYGNAVLAYEIQRAVMGGRPAAMGQALLLMKRSLIENNDDFRQLVDVFADQFELTADEMIQTKYEHLNLYNTFGDPALPMNYPSSEVVYDQIEGTIKKSSSFVVHGHAPGLGDGAAYVTLETLRSTIGHELESPTSDAAIRRNWEKANNKVVTGVTVTMKGGAFEAELVIPAKLPSEEHHIKVYADDGTNDSFGSVVAP